MLDASNLSLTSTELERRFLPLATEAGLPLPPPRPSWEATESTSSGRSLGLVVETDSLRYHRTAFKQAADKRRDNRNALAGRLALRFTHRQVRYEPGYVRAELRLAARRLSTTPVR